MNISKLILKKFLFYFIPLVLIWGIVCVIMMYTYRKNEIEKTIIESKADNVYTSVMIERRMKEIMENIKVIRDASEISEYMKEPDSLHAQQMQTLFLRILKNKERYLQISLMDADGTEISRADRSQQKAGQTVEEPDLSRLNLKYGEFYVSPLVESGSTKDAVGEIFFATPVQNREKENVGTLQVAFQAGDFIELIRGEKEPARVSTNILASNETGRYLLNEKGDRVKDATLDQLNWGNVLSKIDQKAVFIKKSEGSIYIYFDVLSEIKKTSQLFGGRYWVVVQKLPLSEEFSLLQMAKGAELEKSLVVLVVIGIALYISCIVWARIRRKDTQLEITMKIADNSDQAVMITDQFTNISYINQAYERITGYTADEVTGHLSGEFRSGKHNSDFYRQMWKEIRENGEWQGLIWDRKKSGLLYLKLLHIIAVREQKGAVPHHYIGMFSDVIMKKSGFDVLNLMELDIRKDASTEQNVILELLTDSFAKKKVPFQIIHIYIENYNQIVSLMKPREFDLAGVFFSQIQTVIGEEELVIQRSTDQFILIAAERETLSESENFRRNLGRTLSRLLWYDKIGFSFKIRMGSASWPADSQDLETVLSNSVTALEWARRYNREELVRYHAAISETLLREVEMENSLKNALTNGELYLMYQPQIEISTGALKGVEALLRWNSPVLGQVSPSDFIPVAEKSSLIIEIGNWIIQQVCRDLCAIQDSGITGNQPFRCAINVSAVQMEEGSFYNSLMNAVSESGCSLDHLEIEITETVMMDNFELGSTVLRDLQEKGAAIAIDDFGTGYSSLAYLQKMPVDKIKIDRSFIMNYPEKDEGTLIQILVDMAKKLGKTVLAEGVECKTQADFLLESGCDEIQGYYYSRPLLIEDLLHGLTFDKR